MFAGRGSCLFPLTHPSLTGYPFRDLDSKATLLNMIRVCARVMRSLLPTAATAATATSCERTIFAVLVGAGLVTATVATPTAAFAADEAACVAASETSITLRKQGHLKQALEQLAVCADASCPAEVRAECARRIADVRAELPTLILSAKDPAGNDLLDVKVSVDGVPADGILDGRPLPIDPGLHTLTLEAPGRPRVEKKIIIREAEKDRRETVVLDSTSASPSPSPPPAGTSASSGGSSWSTNKTLAVVSAGLGVVGLGLGAGWGIAAISSQNQEKSACPSAGCTGHSQAVSDYDSAHQNGTASTVSFIAGGALLAAGVVLWITAPGSSQESATPAPLGLNDLRLAPVLSATGGGLVLGGQI